MYKKYIKRLLDILISILFIPFIFLTILLIAPIIYLEDRGKIFYNSQRLGKDGKVFIMYKFRTMKENSADLRNEDGSTYNGNNDKRVTKIGGILRKTSIDELPQIFNVLKGNMSFIGPRPDLPEHIKKYSNNEIRRLDVLPGITGYSQAYYRNSIKWKERIKNDIFYIDNISFFLDIRIIFKTLTTVLRRDNIYISQNKKEKETEYAKK